MQRDPQRVRCERWTRIASSPVLIASTVVTLGFHTAMYAYGFMSCRPGGHLWETISGYEGGKMISMTGTWLALPFTAMEHQWKDLGNATCGGTESGRRPSPGWDTWVCTPTMDIRAEDTYSTWKRSFPSMAALMLLFLICGWLSELRNPLPGRERLHLFFGILVIFISFGLLGTALVAVMGVIIMALPRLRMLSSNATLAVTWVLAVTFMELVSLFLGQQPHEVKGWSYDQGIKYWSLLEEIVCGDVLYENKRNSEVCQISRAFVISGLAPWFVFRFMALKFISLAADTMWSFKNVAIRAGLESKCDLVQRTEHHLVVPHVPALRNAGTPMDSNDVSENDVSVDSTAGDSTAQVNFYSLKYYVAYLGYPPLFFAGPILSFNAFVSQLEQPILSYTAGPSQSEQGKRARQSVIHYWIRIFILMVSIEFFSVCWWYSQKLHQITCTDADPYSRCLFDDLSVWELYVGMHVVLHYTWLSLMIIWRFGRAVALADGIDSFENMLACVSFNYTFTEFWRIWHASMNEFMLRYLYWPLGGKNRTWLAVPVVFLFVGFWHERTGFGTQPAWYVWAILNAMGVVINKFIDNTLSRFRKTGHCPPKGPGRWLVELEKSRMSNTPHRRLAQLAFFLGKRFRAHRLDLGECPCHFPLKLSSFLS